MLGMSKGRGVVMAQNRVKGSGRRNRHEAPYYLYVGWNGMRAYRIITACKHQRIMHAALRSIINCDRTIYIVYIVLCRCTHVVQPHQLSG
jgi:hypothetical protein